MLILIYKKSNNISHTIILQQKRRLSISSWTQTSGVGAINVNKIDYSITGDIKWYAIISLQWIEISKLSRYCDGSIIY